MRTRIAITALLTLPAAHGADTLPRHLTGAWGTAESLFEGAEPQIFVFLAADGAGALVGSTRASTKVSEPAPVGQSALADQSQAAEVPAPKVMPRAIIGFPVRATVTGDGLTLQVVVPAAANIPPEKLKLAAFVCRHDAAEVTLTCRGPDGIAYALRFRGDAIPADAQQVVALARQQ